MAIEIKFTDEKGKITNKYRVLDIKTGVVDRCFDFAEHAKKIDEDKEHELPDIQAFYADMRALIVDVFGGQFTYEECGKGAGFKELLRCYNEILISIGIRLAPKN